MNVRILDIQNGKAVLGIVKENGTCGTGRCEGCQCSGKGQTIRISLEQEEGWEVGMEAELVRNRTYLLDGFLLIVLPVLTVILLSALRGGGSLSALLGGGGVFIISALGIRFLRKEPAVTLKCRETKDDRQS